MIFPEGSERTGAVPGVAVEVEAVQPGRVDGGEVRGRQVGDAVAVQLVGVEKGSLISSRLHWIDGSLVLRKLDI